MEKTTPISLATSVRTCPRHDMLLISMQVNVPMATVVGNISPHACKSLPARQLEHYQDMTLALPLMQECLGGFSGPQAQPEERCDIQTPWGGERLGLFMQNAVCQVHMAQQQGRAP